MGRRPSSDGFKKDGGTKSGFRVKRKAFALTYSCPVDRQNPIKSPEHLLEGLVKRFGLFLYIIGREIHPTNGKYHYHVWIKFEEEFESTDSRCFDMYGVHPEIEKRPPGPGWEDYCVKDHDYITNHYQLCPWAVASQSSSVTEAMDHLWKKRPQDCAKFGESIERNLRRRINPIPEAVVYMGPFPAYCWPDFKWSPYTHSLLLWGEPGGMKTQFARYLMSHMFGEYEYIKKGHEMVKTHLTRTKPFIFDEVYLCNKDPEMSKEITDVEGGGSIDCRNQDTWIPPGLPRIFLSNYQFPFCNPKGAVYGRRVQTYEIPVFE